MTKVNCQAIYITISHCFLPGTATTASYVSNNSICVLYSFNVHD